MPFTGTYSVSKTALLSALPPAWCPDLSDNLRQRIQQANRKLIVFDDDPTGAQALQASITGSATLYAHYLGNG